jgi:hypothetical protein
MIDSSERKLLETLYQEVLASIKSGKDLPFFVQVACKKITERRASTFVDRVYEKLCPHLPKSR